MTKLIDDTPSPEQRRAFLDEIMPPLFGGPFLFVLDTSRQEFFLCQMDADAGDGPKRRMRILTFN